MWSREMQNAVCGPPKFFEQDTDHKQSFAVVLWGWLRSYTSGYDGQKGELFAIEEVGKQLNGRLGGIDDNNHPTDTSPVPVSLKTQGSYVS